MKEVAALAGKYDKAVQEEQDLPPEKRVVANVGKTDAKKHLEECAGAMMSQNIVQTMGTMLDSVVF